MSSQRIEGKVPREIATSVLEASGRGYLADLLQEEQVPVDGYVEDWVGRERVYYAVGDGVKIEGKVSPEDVEEEIYNQFVEALEQ